MDKSRNGCQPDGYYRAYGLNLRSSIPLPELPRGRPPADVIVRLGKVVQRPESLDEHGAGIWVHEGQACHFRRDAGAFLASQGREIVVDPAPDAALEVIRLGILGPALGLILQQRGIFALHGSAVAIGDDAVIFLGVSGVGKSTMAALLHLRGYRLLSDDVTALAMDSSGVRVVPSFPQIKLWPDATEALGLAGRMPVLHPEYDKRAHRPVSGFGSEPMPVKRLYLLRKGDDITIRPLARITAFEHLLAQWYGARFGETLVRSIDQRTHFRSCGRLAKDVRMCVLSRPPTLGQDPELPASIEAEILADLGSQGETEA